VRVFERMARASKLKVYRTAAGFHDAYVAAPSQKAALAAWGSDHDLFARGVAELVTDPALMAEPLASPGTVVKRSRGTASEQIAALPPRPSSKPQADEPVVRSKPKPIDVKHRKSKPDRAAIEQAEETLDAVRGEQDRAERSLADREAALARERRAFERDRKVALDEAQAAVDRAQKSYDVALRKWRADR